MFDVIGRSSRQRPIGPREFGRRVHRAFGRHDHLVFPRACRIHLGRPENAQRSESIVAARNVEGAEIRVGFARRRLEAGSGTRKGRIVRRVILVCHEDGLEVTFGR